jgi:hypothetical protein
MHSVATVGAEMEPEPPGALPKGALQLESKQYAIWNEGSI